MSTVSTREPVAHRWPETIVVSTRALVLSASMGARQTFWLPISPLSLDEEVPVATVAFVIAMHKLVWGFAQPFAAADADMFGSAPVVAFGATSLAAGFGLASLYPSGPMLVLGFGILVPLTSGWIAKTFGTLHLGALVGLCFMNHQVGSFPGAWLGGAVLDLTRSHDVMSGITEGLRMVAAALHGPIRDGAGRVLSPAGA